MNVLIGCRSLSTKLDIWSAGVTMMNLICGLDVLPPSNNEQALRDVAALVGVEKVMALADAHDMNVGEILQGVNPQAHLHKLARAFSEDNLQEHGREE